MPIKVAITDDHIMVLNGLKNVLSDEPDILLSGVFQTGNDLLASLEECLPDILLLDLQLTDITGQELAFHILKTHPAVKIIILTGIESPMVIQDMMKAGCKGYLLKTTTDKDQLIDAIKKVYKGELFLEPVIQQKLLHNVFDTQTTTVSSNKKLSTREKEVLRFIALGNTNQQIANMLFISSRTVENHRHNLMQKLEVKNALGLIKAAMDLKLI